MARAYAIELRLRVIKAVEAGIRISKVSKLIKVIPAASSGVF
ncbi:IS630 transposase-related protein [Rickettsia endosymbiont of Gonocerus acuteangulatus]